MLVECIANTTAANTLTTRAWVPPLSLLSIMLSRLSRALPFGACASQSAARVVSRGFAVPAADTADRQQGYRLGASTLAAVLAAGLGSLLLVQPETSHCEEAKLASAGQTQASFWQGPCSATTPAATVPCPIRESVLISHHENSIGPCRSASLSSQNISLRRLQGITGRTAFG